MEFYTIEKARRVITIVFGLSILVIGLALLVLPGPGIPVVLAGLMMLSGQFIWAKRLLAKIHEEVGDAKNFIGRGMRARP